MIVKINTKIKLAHFLTRGRYQIETLDTANEELNNNNIVVLGSVQEEESEIEDDFDKMQIDALKEDDI